MSYIVYDIVIVAIVVLLLIRGVKRGFFRTLLNFAVVVIAYLSSSFLSNMLSVWIFDTFIKQSLTDKISATMQSTMSSANINSIIQTLKDFATFFVPGNSFESNDVISSIQNGVVADVVNAAKPIITTPIRCILFAILMAIIFFISKMLLRPFYRIRIPVIGKIDSILGGIFGAFEGVVIVYIICLIIAFLLPYIDSDFFSYDTIQSTYVFKHFYNMDWQNILAHTKLQIRG